MRDDVVGIVTPHSLITERAEQFTTVATAWQIYELTNSPLQIGLLGLARALPQMCLTLVGGLLADENGAEATFFLGAYVC